MQAAESKDRGEKAILDMNSDSCLSANHFLCVR